MMHLSVSAELPLIGQLELYDKTQSILQTIKSLFASDNNLVAWLILLFSIVVPILKVLLLGAACCLFVMKKFDISDKIQYFVGLIAKWSMADVFVIAILMSFLAAKATPSMQAELHSGFWWFTAYCLISIFAGQLLKFEAPNRDG